MDEKIGLEIPEGFKITVGQVYALLSKVRDDSEVEHWTYPYPKKDAIFNRDFVNAQRYILTDTLLPRIKQLAPQLGIRYDNPNARIEKLFDMDIYRAFAQLNYLYSYQQLLEKGTVQKITRKDLIDTLGDYALAPDTLSIPIDQRTFFLKHAAKLNELLLIDGVKDSTNLFEELIKPEYRKAFQTVMEVASQAKNITLSDHVKRAVAELQSTRQVVTPKAKKKETEEKKKTETELRQQRYLELAKAFKENPGAFKAKEVLSFPNAAQIVAQDPLSQVDTSTKLFQDTKRKFSYEEWNAFEDYLMQNPQITIDAFNKNQEFDKFMRQRASELPGANDWVKQNRDRYGV